MDWIKNLKRGDDVIIRDRSRNDSDFVATVDETSPDGKIISACIVFTDGIAEVTGTTYSLIEPSMERVSILKAEYLIRHCNPTYEQSKKLIEIFS